MSIIYAFIGIPKCIWRIKSQLKKKTEQTINERIVEKSLSKMKPGIFPREHNNNRPSFLISPPDGNAPLINWKSGADQSQKSPSSICAYDKIKIACREMQLPSPKKKYIYICIYIYYSNSHIYVHAPVGLGAVHLLFI